MATVASSYLPLWVRVWHWALAVLLIILVPTGIVLHFSGREFALMDYSLATTLHYWAGNTLAVVYLLFLPVLVVTGHWRSYWPRWRGMGHRFAAQVRGQAAAAVLGGRRVAPSATAQPFSPLQRFGYILAILVLMPLLIVTGLRRLVHLLMVFALLPLMIISGVVYFFPEWWPTEFMGLPGVWPIAVVHYAVSLVATVYILLHIYMATVGGLRRIITGHSHAGGPRATGEWETVAGGVPDKKYA